MDKNYGPTCLQCGKRSNYITGRLLSVQNGVCVNCRNNMALLRERAKRKIRQLHAEFDRWEEDSPDNWDED